MKKQQGFISYIALIVIVVLIICSYIYFKKDIKYSTQNETISISDISTTTKVKFENLKITQKGRIKTAAEIKDESWIAPCTPFTDISKNIPTYNINNMIGFFSEKFESFYEIKGDTAGRLFYQMNNCIPSNNGVSVAAVTYTNFTRTFNYNSIGGRVCNIKDIGVGVHSTVLYPRWTPPKGVDSSLINKWNKYVQKLKIHEEGHVAIGNKYSKKYYDFLMKISRGGDCLESISILDAEQDRITKEMDDANIEYDFATDHGVSQGASFSI